jgi:antitoxin MazE
MVLEHGPGFGILNVDTDAMRTRVQKWGNSLAVRIPKPFAEGAGLRPSTEVEISLEKGELRLALARPRFRLDQLLSRVTKRNRHPEVESGPIAGRELW